MAVAARGAPAVELEHREHLLVGLDVRAHARDRLEVAAAVDAVAPAAGAAAAGRVVEHQARQRLAVLVEPGEDHQVEVGVPDGHRLVLERGAGAEHLADHGARDVLGRLLRAHARAAARRRELAVVDRPRLRDDLDDVLEAAGRPGHLVGEHRQHRGHHPAAQRRDRAVDHPRRLRRGAGEVEDQLVPALLEPQLDLVELVGDPVVIEVHVVVPLPVGDLVEARLHRVRDLLLELPRGGLERVLAVALDDLEHASPGRDLRGDARAQVEPVHHRRPRVAQQERLDLVAVAAAVHELQRRDDRTLLEHVRRRRPRSCPGPGRRRPGSA